MATNRQTDDPYDVAGSNYEQNFNKTGKELRSREDAAANPEDAKKDIKAKEATGNVVVKRKKKKKKPSTHKRRLLAKLRNKSAFAFIIVVIIFGIGYSYIIAPNIILVNIKDLFTNDLADATTALGKYTVKMIDFKLGKSDCGEKDSIKCKLTTMSRNQKETLERHGFTVNGEKVEEDDLDDNDPTNDKAKESRWKVSSIDFPEGAGSASSGESYAKLADTNDHVRYLTNGVWNPKSSFFHDTRFRQRLKQQFDLTQTVTTYGNTEEQVDKSFNESMQGKNEKIDKSGRGAFSLKGLADKGKDGLNEASKKVADMANSYGGLQCAYYTMGKIAYNSGGKAKQTSIARFAMQYLKAADQIKAGINDEITINTLAGKLAWSEDGGYAGANATDASMYRHIVLREGLKDSGNGNKYYNNAFDVQAALLPTWIQLMITAKTVKGISKVSGDLTAPPADMFAKPRDYCVESQKDSTKAGNKPNDCPALTIGGTPPPMIPAVAAIAALSTRVCPPPPQGIWMEYPTTHATALVVMPYVANLLIGAVTGWAGQAANDFTADTKGIAASDAIFAGTGIILGDMAMSRGMKPASTASLKQYLAAGADERKRQEDIERYAAQQKPFDIYNRYSFFGSMARSLSNAAPLQKGPLGSVTNLLAFIPASIKGLSPQANAIYNLQPDQLDTSRLRCADVEYLKLEINADMGCNVRYSMNSDELNADIKDVLDYMLKSHSDETQKNVDELQKRLDETDHGADMQDQQDVQRQLDEAKEANGEPFIDKKTGKPIKNSEFEKFMTYCVNREELWGRTAMAVRREGLSDEDKEKRHQDNDAYGNKVGKNGGDEYEMREVSSYMSVSEGASADQDWYSGKKCTQDNEMLKNFRAYTMACSVDGSFAGSPDCTELDHEGAHADDFYTSNDIHYLSWW